MLDRGSERLLPAFLEPLARELERPPVLITVGVLSAAMFVGSLLAIPHVLRRLPADFPSHGRHAPEPGVRRSVGSILLRGLKNVLGLMLLGAGILALVLPGQGVLMIVVSLVLIDFPGKPRLVRRIFRSKKVLEVANRIRKRGGKEPFEAPPERASQP